MRRRKFSENSLEAEAREIYDSVSKDYAGSRHAKSLLAHHYELTCVLQALGAIRSQRILDVGCGPGWHLSAFAGKGAQVSGVDLSPAMIETARNRCPTAELRVGTLRKLPWREEQFDVVTATLVLQYVKTLRRPFEEFSRVLRKQGRLLFLTHSPWVEASTTLETASFRVRGVGYLEMKKGARRMAFGSTQSPRVVQHSLVPGISISSVAHSFGDYVRALHRAGFELTDVIDCRPPKALNRAHPERYRIACIRPEFTLWMARKK